MKRRTGSEAETQALCERLRGLGSCLVSDALDAYRLAGAATGLVPFNLAGPVVAGPVRTLILRPADGTASGGHVGTQLVEALRPGEVVAIDSAGIENVSSWGGILATAAIRVQAGGVVIDGAFRDLDDCQGLGLSVFARRVVPVSARTRLRQAAIDADASIGGVAVSPGDLVVADLSGVVFVPRGRATEVVSFAEQLRDREAMIMAGLDSGSSLVELMDDTTFPTVMDQS